MTFVKELENALSVHDKQLYDSYQNSRKRLKDCSVSLWKKTF